MRKFLGIAVVALIVLLAAAAFAVTRDWDSPELGRALLQRASAAGGLEIEADGFRLNVLRGLKLENVRVRGNLEGGGSLNATAESLVLEHQLGPLLSGEVLVEQIVLEHPNVELVSVDPAAGASGTDEPAGDAGSPAETAEPAAEESGSDLTLKIQRFAIVDGTFVTRVEGVDEPPTEIRGLDLELRDITSDPAAPTLIQGLRAAGEISADEVISAAAQGRDASGDLLLEGGHLKVTEFQMPTELGNFLLSELDVNLNEQPNTYDLKLAGDRLKTHLMLGGEDGTFGTAKLDLTLSGQLADEMRLVGLGKIAITTGKLPDNAVLRALEKLLNMPIVGQEYNPFEVDFKIERDLIIANPFSMIAGDVELGALGAIGLFDESLALELAALAPKELLDIKEIPDEILEALTDTDGRVNLPIIVAGTRLSPSTKFNREGWSKLVRKRVQKEVEKELGKALSGLFGRKKDG